MAQLNWRIDAPDGEKFDKQAIQTFLQDPKQPGVLYNHDNEYLHYQDDWCLTPHASPHTPHISHLAHPTPHAALRTPHTPAATPQPTFPRSM